MSAPLSVYVLTLNIGPGLADVTNPACRPFSSNQTLTELREHLHFQQWMWNQPACPSSGRVKLKYSAGGAWRKHVFAVRRTLKPCSLILLETTGKVTVPLVHSVTCSDKPTVSIFHIFSLHFFMAHFLTSPPQLSPAAFAATAGNYFQSNVNGFPFWGSIKACLLLLPPSQ